MPHAFLAVGDVRHGVVAAVEFKLVHESEASSKRGRGDRQARASDHRDCRPSEDYEPCADQTTHPVPSRHHVVEAMCHSAMNARFPKAKQTVDTGGRLRLKASA